jgi:hypothetical protein
MNGVDKWNVGNSIAKDPTLANNFPMLQCIVSVARFGVGASVVLDVRNQATASPGFWKRLITFVRHLFGIVSLLEHLGSLPPETKRRQLDGTLRLGVSIRLCKLRVRSGTPSSQPRCVIFCIAFPAIAEDSFNAFTVGKAANLTAAKAKGTAAKTKLPPAKIIAHSESEVDASSSDDEKDSDSEMVDFEDANEEEFLTEVRLHFTFSYHIRTYAHTGSAHRRQEDCGGSHP